MHFMSARPTQHLKATLKNNIKEPHYPNALQTAPAAADAVTGPSVRKFRPLPTPLLLPWPRPAEPNINVNQLNAIQ
jgi:hypothetical protein